MSRIKETEALYAAAVGYTKNPTEPGRGYFPERELRACAMEFAAAFLRDMRAICKDKVVTVEYALGMMETYVAGARGK